MKESDKPEENTRQNPLVGQSASGMQNMSGETNGFDRKKEASGITDMQRAALQKELERTGVPIETVLGRYQISDVEQMTPDIYRKALNSLKKSKTKHAA